MKVLVTAGPTREYIDAVRFLSNPSSGRMGYAVAEAFASAGHEVILVSGPTNICPPPCGKFVRVESTLEMRKAVQAHLDKCDCVVMAAAVSDYRPAKRIRGKMKKAKRHISLRLIRNPDILEEIGKHKGNKLLIGFAVESGAGRKNALLKMKRKNLDLIVLNAPSSFDASSVTGAIYDADGGEIPLKNKPKERVAAQLVRLVSEKGTA